MILAESDGMFAPGTGEPRPEATVPAAKYYQAALPGKAGSVRVNRALIERLAREIRNTARSDGDQLAGILLGRILTDERCAVIEDYQTITRSLHRERLYDSGGDRANLERILTIWQSDPDGKIRAIGFFRTDDRMTPAPGKGDAALLARHLPAGDGTLLLIGPERGGKAEAGLYAGGGQIARGGRVRLPWSGTVPDGEAAAPPAVRPARWAAVAGTAAVAVLGAGLLWDRMPQPSEESRPAAVVRQAATPALPRVAVDTGAAALAAGDEVDRPQEPAHSSLDRAAVVQPVSSPAPTPASYVVLLPAPERTKGLRALRPGGQLEPAVPISKIEPAYPRLAAEAHVAGTVRLGATVGTDGQLRDVHALAGPALLQEAAIQAVRRWRYKPAALDGSPVETEAIIELVFGVDR
jgi:protein TonB